MAVRTAFDAVAGTMLTAANLDKYPGGWIGYVERTTSQTGVSTLTDITSVTVTVTVGTSRRLLVEGCIRVTQNSAPGNTELVIDEDGSTVGISTLTIVSGGNIAMHHPRCVRTPGSGSHTYKLRAQTNAGTLTIDGATTQPIFILVQDIGPSA